MEGNMAVAQQDENEMDAEESQKGDQAADAEEANAQDGDAAAAETDAEADSAKEEVHPALTVTSPGSGAQFPADQPIAIEFDCEGDVEFTAHVALVDASGTQVLEDATDLKLEENQGHGSFSLADEAILAGKYDVLVWGESNGEATAVQKLQVEVVETEAEEEVAPAVSIEGDDGDGDDAAA
jgi:hypothetical protein